MWKKVFCVFLSFGMMVGSSGCGAKPTEKNLSSIHFAKAEDLVGEKSPEERAHTIKSSLRQIGGIAGNAVVVEGHTAIIGLRLAEGMEGESTRLIQAAKDAAQGADVAIDSASVTTNGRIVSLIEEMEHQRAK